jgi:glycosyltransferase involved in cell wall biosynthesis
MYRALRQSGYPTTIFAEHIHAAFASVTTKPQLDADQFWLDREAILIYHHAIDWPLGEEILRRSKNKVVIKYHNVTPPEFYRNYVEFYYSYCLRGVAATKRLAQVRVDRIWGASQFNNEEFIRLGVPREHCRVSPPIHHIDDLGRAPLDAIITGAYRGATPNILFVGAFRPNKGHFKAIEAFAAYRELSARPARLFFVGSFDPLLGGYVEELKHYARMLEVEDSMFLAPSVTLSQLRAYYSIASVFLCVSEHEGFCVPLVEAMFFRVPIVAWATTAVSETCGGCGIVFQDFDASELAKGIEECVENPAVSRTLARRGRERYESTFCPEAIRAHLLGLVEEVQHL